jgi:hypothetical protein
MLGTALSRSVLAAEWKGERVVKDGVVHVLNPAEPMEPPEVYELQELWRLESETPDGGLVFGTIADAATGKEGNTYLLDMQLRVIHVLSPRGEYLRSMGRPGEGPGDLQAPEDIFVTSEGLVGVTDDRPARITFFTPEGTLAGSWKPTTSPGTVFIPFRCEPRADGYVLSYKTLERRSDVISIIYHLARMNRTGTSSAAYWTRSQDLRREARIVFREAGLEPINVFAVDPTGQVFVSPNYGEYAIYVLDPDGPTRRVIQRQFDHFGRSRQQIQSTSERLRSIHSSWRNAQIDAEDYDRDIADLTIRDDGSLWVQTSRGWFDNPPGTALVLDVFDDQGLFRRQAILRGPLDPQEDQFLLLDSQAIRVATTLPANATPAADPETQTAMSVAGAGTMAVICYELSLWNPGSQTRGSQGVH